MRTTIALLAFLSLPATASAQTRRHAGFVGQLQLGLGWCTDDACDESNPIDAQYGTGASFGMFLGYRFPFPYFSIGANLQYSLHPVDDEEAFAADATSAHSFGFDFGGRVHPLVKGPIDPWIGIGFGYAFAGASWSNTRERDAEESTSLDGPSFAFSLGGDYWLSEKFALGVAFRYVVVWWSQLCVDTVDLERVYPDATCESPEEWEDRRLRNPDGSRFDQDSLPDLVQLLVTGTFSP